MKRTRRIAAIALGVGAASSVVAQPALSCNGFADVVYVGNQVQDFLVPDLQGSEVFFTVQGADGGNAQLLRGNGDVDQDFLGGEGA